tara:strand:+ start:5530 stop:6642 length:1113 start_codon:yes stop_codon:yes gene_type:complete
MNNRIRFFRNKIKCLPWKILSKLGFYKGNKIPVKFVVENVDWAIKFVGENIKREIEIIAPEKLEVSDKPYKIVNSLVHFGSQYMWLNWSKYMSNENRYIASFFHGKPEDGEEVKIHIDLFLESVERLEKVVTASSLTQKRLMGWGVPKNKLVKIPLGVNTSLFNLPLNYQKKSIRTSLGISEHFILIGSFQKDGSGWKDGLDPKLIKGPDLFVSTLRLLLSRGYPVYALLTGPARGYVKKELEKFGIPYFHTFPKNHNELISLYHALDIYLITSREEGGPMGLLESIACGTPVASTNVGMAGDIITDKITGVLADRIEVENIAQKVEYLINMSKKQKKELQINSRKVVENCDWRIVAKQHWEKVYNPLIN